MSEVESTGDGDSLNDSDGDGTDSPEGSTHVDEHGEHLNESDPIADHLEEEDPQDITSTLPVSECHDAPLKREEGTDDDYIEPYLTAYHFVVTSHDSQEQDQASVDGDKTTNQNNNSLSQPTPKCQDVPSTVTKTLVCLLKYYKDVAIFIFVTTLVIVGLLLITGILPPEEGITSYTDSNSYHGHLMSENMTGVAGTKDTPTMVTRILDFDERPSTVAMSANGKIAVAFSDPSIYIYDREGIFLLRFGTTTMTWAFPPHDVSFCNCTGDEGVLVVGGNNILHRDRVALYSVTGRLITSFAIPSTPAHHRLAFSKNHSLVYVTETVGNHREVKVYGLDGTLVRRFGREQMLTSLAAIAVDNEDYILVTDSYSAKIYVYDNNGKFMFSFAGKGIGNGKLGFPVDICTDSSRHIIVADLGNKRVEMFSSRGKFIRTIATDVDPLRMAVGPAGQLILVEAAKKKVTILIEY
uniref:SMP-30/Gluconolactonase/LRE-like region domain-containing protein n=1 Tax=Branchiostoma floridae TaxID=7739 RepID=C3Y8T7_BRAFL|eukprot:XP_002606983.1 hypothetical protein BRAFLDRAFT_64967 [Branchiostoma floridae]